jgi:hypothetical protein
VQDPRPAETDPSVTAPSDAASRPTVALWPYLTGAASTVALAVIVALSLVANLPIGSGPTAVTPPPPAALDAPAAATSAAFEAAGCEVLADREPLEDRSHVEHADGVDLDELYPDVRPTHSGQHSARVHPVVARSGSQLDELATTHNLEHGAVLIWWNPDRLSTEESRAIGDLADWLHANGHLREDVGIGILTAPYDDPGLPADVAVAFRAWGTAVDCASYDEAVALAFVRDNFGAAGIAPERTLAPTPHVLGALGR